MPILIGAAVVVVSRGGGSMFSCDVVNTFTADALD
jgi:hypothetical protein